MSDLEGRDILSTGGLSREDIELVMRTASKFEPTLADRTKNELLSDKVLCSMFFQPSTRTRLSFESAMCRLGGSVIGFANPQVSRAGDDYKETLDDTARMIEKYGDVIAMRHYQDGIPAAFAEVADIPVLNGGDGDNEHPTQALLDLYTVWRERGTLAGLKVLQMGDQSYRAFHSMGLGLAKFDDTELYLLSPEELRVSPEWRKKYDASGLNYREVTDVKKVVKDVDVIYVLGVIRKRSDMPSPDKYRLNLDKIRSAKPDMMILHPLPRFDEIPTDVDSTAHARYLTTEPTSGVLVRMALISLVLGRSATG